MIKAIIGANKQASLFANNTTYRIYTQWCNKGRLPEKFHTAYHCWPPCRKKKFKK